MASQQDKNINKAEVPNQDLSQKAESAQRQVELTTKSELAPLGSKVEMDILSKEIENDTKQKVDIESNFDDLSFDKVPVLPEEKKKFELFQKETFILLHQLVAINDNVIAPEDLKLKAGGLFFDPALQEHYILSEKAKGLHGKLQTLYGYLLSGTEAQKQNARLIFDHWNPLIDQIQKGVAVAVSIKAKIADNDTLLQKKKVELPPAEKSIWDKIVENKSTLMTTAAVGLGVYGAVKFISSLFGSKKEEKSEHGGFWKWLIGGGAVLGAVGLTMLSGKNPLEMMTSFFGDKALKVVLENTLKPLLGDKLTDTFIKKLDGKVSPEEFTNAYKKDGGKGIAQLLAEKKIDFTEDEKKEIAEKFGLPEAIMKLLPTTQSTTTEVVNNPTAETKNTQSAVNISNNTIEKVPAAEALKHYGQDLTKALSPIGSWLKVNTDTAAAAFIVFPSLRALAFSAGKNSLDFSAGPVLKLAKLDWLTINKLSLTSLFGVTGYFLSKEILLPKDSKELKKVIDQEKGNVIKWMQEQGYNIPDEDEWKDITAILTRDKKLEEYLGKPESITKNFAKILAENLLINSPEQLVKEKNLLGLRNFKDYLKHQQDLLEDTKYAIVIAALEKVEKTQKLGQKIKKEDVENLHDLLEQADALSTITTEQGYVRFRKKDAKGIWTEGPYNICVDPTLDAVAAHEKARNFITGYGAIEKTQIFGLMTQRVKEMGGDVQKAMRGPKEAEEELGKTIFEKLKSGTGRVILIGTEWMFEGASQTYFFGPLNLTLGAFKAFGNYMKGQDANYTQYFIDLANGAVPVAVFALGTTTLVAAKSVTVGLLGGKPSGVKFATKAKILTQMATYPITGFIEVEEIMRRHMLAPLMNREFDRILKNPRDRLSVWSKKHVETVREIASRAGSKMNMTDPKIASSRNNITKMYESIQYLRQAEMKILFSSTFYDAARESLETVPHAKEMLEKLNLKDVTPENRERIITALEEQIQKERNYINQLAKQHKLQKEIGKNKKANIDVTALEAKQVELNTKNVETAKNMGKIDTSSTAYDNQKLNVTKQQFDALPNHTEKVTLMKSTIQELDTFERAAEKIIQEKTAEFVRLHQQEGGVKDSYEVRKKISTMVEEEVKKVQQKKNPLLALLFEQHKNLPKDLKTSELAEEFGKILDNRKKFATKISLVGPHSIALSGVKATMLFVGMKSLEATGKIAYNTFASPEKGQIEETPQQIFTEVFSGVSRWDIAQFAVDICPLYVGALSSLYSAVSGKQLVTGREMTGMEQVASGLWATAGFALDTVSLVGAPVTGGASLGLNMYAKIQKIAKTEGVMGKLALKLQHEWPRIAKVAERVGWKRVAEELYAFANGNKAAIKAGGYGAMGLGMTTALLGPLTVNAVYESERTVSIDPTLIEKAKKVNGDT
ncbi:MAG: hypothetical protein ACK4NC_04755 [Candidatus Gracilibacteria bacterium]